MHYSSCRIAQKSLHQNAGSIVMQTAANVLTVSTSAIRCASFPVTHSLSEVPASKSYEERCDSIKRKFDAAVNIAKNFAMDGIFIVETKNGCSDSR
jgi:hypothetical protein